MLLNVMHLLFLTSLNAEKKVPDQQLIYCDIEKKYINISTILFRLTFSAVTHSTVIDYLYRTINQ